MPDPEVPERPKRRRFTIKYKGFIWGNLESSERPDVKAFLGPLDEELARHRFGQYSLQGTKSLLHKFNWKSGMEAFLENYHFRALHPWMGGYHLSRNDTALADTFGRHVRVIVPTEAMLVDNLGRSPNERSLLPHHGIIVYGILPSTLIFIENRHATVFHYRFTEPAECNTKIIHMVEPDYPENKVDNYVDKFMKAVNEDFELLEHAQDGYLAGSVARLHDEVLIGRNEPAIQMFRTSLAEAMMGTIGEQL